MNLNAVISDHLARGGKGALVTIAEKNGSAPRDEGAQMFVTARGEIFGTIGGGSMEARASLEAVQAIETGHHRMFHCKMDGKNAAEEDMICGGNIGIFIEPLEERHREVYEAASNAIKRTTHGFIVTRYSETGLTKSFISNTRTVVGDPLDEETKTLIPTSGERLIATDGLIVAPILSRSRLYIFGAGHVSQHICRIASMVNFDVTVVDDRDDYSNAARFPEARETVVEDFNSVFEHLSFSGSEYIVIVTRGHKHDTFVLEQVLEQSTRYIGMIGSRRKTAMVFDHLKNQGFDNTLLERVFAPIGLDIGAETPEEIAVSIVAELIRTRNLPNAEQNLSMKRVSHEAPRHHPPDHHKVLFG
jgi:xanthine dehydrogenase accessory factor